MPTRCTCWKIFPSVPDRRRDDDLGELECLDVLGPHRAHAGGERSHRFCGPSSVATDLLQRAGRARRSGSRAATMSAGTPCPNGGAAGRLRRRRQAEPTMTASGPRRTPLHMAPPLRSPPSVMIGTYRRSSS